VRTAHALENASVLSVVAQANASAQAVVTKASAQSNLLLVSASAVMVQRNKKVANAQSVVKRAADVGPTVNAPRKAQTAAEEIYLL
jgi:hypothetical protein